MRSMAGLDEAGRSLAPTSCTLLCKRSSTIAAALLRWALALLTLLLVSALVGAHAVTCRSGLGRGGGGSGAGTANLGFRFTRGLSTESRTTL